MLTVHDENIDHRSFPALAGYDNFLFRYEIQVLERSIIVMSHGKCRLL